MLVSDVVKDVATRLEHSLLDMNMFGPQIIRAMNRVYNRINVESGILKKEYEMDFSTLSTFVNRWTLPSDFWEMIRIEPHQIFIEPNQFVDQGDSVDTIQNSYTFLGGEIIFAGADEDSVYNMWYISSGLTLANKETEDLAATETNAIEWPQESLHQVLFYGTCLDMSVDYKMRKMDEVNFMKGMSMLSRTARKKTTNTPTTVGRPRGFQLRDGYR